MPAHCWHSSAAVADIRRLGIIVSPDLDDVFWMEAGRLKSVWRKVSLADCLALMLTLRVGGELITSDHHELDPLAAAGVCPINFFR